MCSRHRFWLRNYGPILRGRSNYSTPSKRVSHHASWTLQVPFESLTRSYRHVSFVPSALFPCSQSEAACSFQNDYSTPSRRVSHQPSCTLQPFLSFTMSYRQVIVFPLLFFPLNQRLAAWSFQNPPESLAGCGTTSCSTFQCDFPDTVSVKVYSASSFC